MKEEVEQRLLNRFNSYFGKLEQKEKWQKAKDQIAELILDSIVDLLELENDQQVYKDKEYFQLYENREGKFEFSYAPYKDGEFLYEETDEMKKILKKIRQIPYDQGIFDCIGRFLTRNFDSNDFGLCLSTCLSVKLKKPAKK